MSESAITMRENQIIETTIINMVDSRVCFKIIAKGNFIKLQQVNTSLEGTFHQQLKTGTTGISEFDTYNVKKIIY